MSQTVIGEPVPDKEKTNSADAQSKTNDGESTNGEIDGRSSADKHDKQSRDKKESKGDKKRKRPSVKNGRNVKSKPESSSPHRKDTSLTQILGPSLNDLLSSPPASDASAGADNGESSSVPLAAREKRKPVRLTAVKQQLQQRVEESERLKTTVQLLEKEIDRKNKEIERINKNVSSHKIEIKKLIEANDNLMRQLSKCKANNTSPENVDNGKCDLSDLKKHVSVAKSLLAAVDAEDDDSDFVRVSRRQRSKPSVPPSVPPLPVATDRVVTPLPANRSSSQDSARLPSATAATQGPSDSAAKTPAIPTAVKSHPSRARARPKMAVIGTSLVRGLGHKLTKRGFDVTTFMYPGAELPVIRDHIPAILYNDFQPDVVVLQCAGNDIGNGRPTAQVVEQLDCLVQEIKRCSPGADIIINRIPPRGHNSNLIAEIEMVNTYITNVSKQRGLGVYCSDACPKMYRYFRKDAVHLNHAGKQLYANEMAKVLMNFPRRSLHQKR